VVWPIYPAPLVPGQRIAVTAPSSGVEAALHPRLDLALVHLRSQGFVVEEGQCLRQEHMGASAPAAQRATELMSFLLRDDIQAVLPPWGGELAIEVLDLLDWAALAQARPKWLIGFSDTSTLLLPLTLRLGWATVHFSGLMDWVPGQSDPLSAGALPALATATGGTLLQRPSSQWQRKWGDFAAEPGCTYALSETTQWRWLNPPAPAPAPAPAPGLGLGHEVADASAVLPLSPLPPLSPLSPLPTLKLSGRLIGGCLDTLMHLAGTPFGDVPGFLRRCGSQGTLLYLENAELSPTAWVRALHALRWHGWLDGLSGVLIGRSAAPDTDKASQLSYAQALTSTLAALPCPVLVDLDIGHVPPQMLLINGALAELHVTHRNGAIQDAALRQQLI